MLQKKSNISMAIKELLKNAKKQVLHSVNSAMVYTYFEIGRILIEEEQNGKNRAEYGKNVLKEVSKSLTKEFGKGFSVQNLERMRKFYQIYSKSSTLLRISDESKKIEKIKQNNFVLSWSHYLFLMRLKERETGLFNTKSKNT